MFTFLAVPAVSFSECPTFAFVTFKKSLFKGLPLDWFRLFVSFSFIFQEALIQLNPPLNEKHQPGKPDKSNQKCDDKLVGVKNRHNLK